MRTEVILEKKVSQGGEGEGVLVAGSRNMRFIKSFSLIQRVHEVSMNPEFRSIYSRAH
jgi:hypothetical protein